MFSIFTGVLRKPKSANRPKSVREQRTSSSDVPRQNVQSAANLSKCISVRPLSRDKGEQKAPPLHDNWVTDQEMDDEVNFLHSCCEYSFVVSTETTRARS